MTASCKYTPDDQVEFAYGEMEQNQAESFRAHLETCKGCQAAVAELEAAAKLTKQVRSAPIPEAKWEKSFEVPSSRPSGLWRRPLFWAPVAAAAAALILFAVLRPTPTPVEPTPPPVEKVTPPLPPEPPPVFATVIETTGKVTVPEDGKVQAGDTLKAFARSSVLLQLQDRSQIFVGEKSKVKIEALGEKGDRLLLERGHVACRVTPRKEDRPFAVDTDLGNVKVTGTLFAVLKVSEKKLMVGVHKGSVDVNGQAVKAGRQITLEKAKSAVRHAALGRKMRKLMQHFLPEEVHPPVRKPPPSIDVQPEEPPPEEPPVKETKPKESTADTLAALVDNMYKDTDWIFDDLRADIDRGNWEVVLHRLENYLLDPESPNRAEAIFLRAVCLEKLGRLKEAHQGYRTYLEKWPAGNRAKKAKHGLMRTRKAR
jgi:ferric-dicitrate binding protein FerR (iron transport regulator)